MKERERGMREREKMQEDEIKFMVDSGKVMWENANKAAVAYQERLAQIREIVVSGLTPAFEGFFNTLISGGGNALSNLTSAIGQMITKLISAALAAAALAAILAATGLGTALNFAGASQGFSGIFKGLLGGIVGHASGGITNKPHLAMVGEGKEREVITPLSQLKNIIGNVGGSRAMPVPQLYMRGADMWIMWQRQQQQNLRSY